MSHAERGTVYSGDGRHGSDPGLYATLRLPGWKKTAVFLILVVVGCALWFAASPGVTSALFGVCLRLWSPNLPFVSVASVACGAMAMAGGFVFPKGFYLWGVALAIHSPFTQGLSVYVMEREGVGLERRDDPGRWRGPFSVFGTSLVCSLTRASGERC